MLQLSHLKKTYNKTEVLSDIDYIFEPGRLYPLLGGIGSGRTTLFECICEDLSVDSGEIKTLAKRDICLAARQSLLPMYLTGYEFVQYLCDLQKDKKEPAAYLEWVGLSEEMQNTLICEYSFENKKRLQLAAFLIQRPYVMMFDEPLDYCSDEYIDCFLQVLDTVKDEHIILISTGLLDIARRIGKELVVLNNGELNTVTDEMLDIPEIRQAILDILGESEE